MASMLLCMILASNLALGAAMRNKEQVQFNVESNETSSGSSTDERWIGCPAECQQCCSAHSYDIGILAWGNSEERYKCILNSKTLPSPTKGKCKDPVGRNHANAMYKTECPFDDDKAWEALKGKECNKYTKCCCDKNDDWTETVCLDATDDITTAPSSNPKAKGQDQTYKKASQAYYNEGKCEGDVTAKDYSTDYDLVATDHGKCCVETVAKSKSVMVSGSCQMEGGYPCDEMMCAADNNCMGGGMNWCGKKQVCQYEDKHWTACKKFQTLFYCAEDKLHPTKTRYTRKSIAKGVCMGDKTKDETQRVIHHDGKVDCPSGFTHHITGHTCKCDTRCGAA